MRRAEAETTSLAGIRSLAGERPPPDGENSARSLGVADGFGAADGRGRTGGRIITMSGVGAGVGGGTTTIGRGVGVAGRGVGGRGTGVEGTGVGVAGRAIGVGATSSMIVTVSVTVSLPTGRSLIGRPGVGAGKTTGASPTTRPG